jgi:hypothetical protein
VNAHWTGVGQPIGILIKVEIKEEASTRGTYGAKLIVMVERWAIFCRVHRGQGLSKGNQSRMIKVVGGDAGSGGRAAEEGEVGGQQMGVVTP